jgi:hypothetical protein
MDYRNIEKRRYNRFDIALDCEIMVNGRSYAGVTKNVSLHGLYVRFHPVSADSMVNFSFDNALKILCNISSDNKVNLDCLVRWAHFSKDPSVGAVEGMGVEIKNPPSTYMDFIMKLE